MLCLADSRYRGIDTAAELFYEEAVTEAVSLVLGKAAQLAESNTGAARLKREDAAVMGELCAFVDAHLADDLSCEALAAHAYLGQTKLKQLFRKAAGASPCAYVTERRMARAHDELAHTDKPVAAVARSVGYVNAGAFSTAFRRRFGCAPSSVRK